MGGGRWGGSDSLKGGRAAAAPASAPYVPPLTTFSTTLSNLFSSMEVSADTLGPRLLVRTTPNSVAAVAAGRGVLKAL